MSHLFFQIFCIYCSLNHDIMSANQNSSKTGRLVEAATLARGSMALHEKFDSITCSCSAGSVVDEKMEEVFRKYKKERYEMAFLRNIVSRIMK